MKDCRDIAPWLATLADDGPSPEPEVVAHLEHCPSCQRSLRLQREMHGLLRARAATLQGRAPEALRARLAGQVQPRVTATRRWLPLRVPVAATLVLTLLGTILYGLTSSSATVLAAQLALDHLKCVKLVSTGTVVNPVQAARDWAQHYHWTPKMPAPPKGRRASLMTVRRCLLGHGHLAHLMYEVDGTVVSLFVMPRADAPAGDEPTGHAFLGQQAQLWSSGDQSFALVADVDPAQLQRLAEEFRAAE